MIRLYLFFNSPFANMRHCRNPSTAGNFCLNLVPGANLEPQHEYFKINDINLNSVSIRTRRIRMADSRPAQTDTRFFDRPAPVDLLPC